MPAADATTHSTSPTSSRGRPERTICRTVALKKYHLRLRDLDGLKYTESTWPVEGKLRPMFVYKEADVEQVALRKHGGQQGFMRMLQRSAQRRSRTRRAKGSRNPFPQPQYEAGQQLRPAMARMRAELERTGKGWMWKPLFDASADAALERCGWGDPDKKQESILRMAFEDSAEGFVKWSPARPNKDPGSIDSASFRALKDVLDRAPVYKEEAGDGIKKIDGCYPDYEDHYEWTDEYRDEVYRALLGIIDEHGKEGWKSARWLVYDKRIKCEFPSIVLVHDHHDGDRWVDCSWDWLHEDPFFLDEPLKTQFKNALRNGQVSK